MSSTDKNKSEWKFFLSCSIKNTHAAATLGDQANIKVGNLYVRWSMHIEFYPAVGCWAAAPISAVLNQWVVFRQILTSISITGTSIKTPTTVARAAPEDNPNSMWKWRWRLQNGWRRRSWRPVRHPYSAISEDAPDRSRARRSAWSE